MNSRLRVSTVSLAFVVAVGNLPAAGAAPVENDKDVVEVQANEVVTGPPPTQEQIQEIHEDLGPEAVAAFHQAQLEASNGERAVPIIAGVAIAAVAWCASGALSSVPTSVLSDMVNRGEGGGDYVRNAIIGCAVGNVGSLAWKLIPSGVKQSILNAVVRFYLNNIRK